MGNVRHLEILSIAITCGHIFLQVTVSEFRQVLPRTHPAWWEICNEICLYPDTATWRKNVTSNSSVGIRNSSFLIGVVFYTYRDIVVGTREKVIDKTQSRCLGSPHSSEQPHSPDQEHGSAA